ncbi:uncharacterized protein LOC144456355 [Phascolarctos cinereus]
MSSLFEGRLLRACSRSSPLRSVMLSPWGAGRGGKPKLPVPRSNSFRREPEARLLDRVRERALLATQEVEAGNMTKCFLVDHCYDDDGREETKEEEVEEEYEEKEEDEDYYLTQEAMAVFERLKNIDCLFVEDVCITEPKTIK